MALAPAWHRLVLRLIGVRVHVTGELARERPLLLLSNHMSWLDIEVLGALAPVSFVAKKEVAGWPVFGWLARLQRSVFIDRDRRHTAGSQAEEMASRLSQGDIIVLFAEGTSSDGNRVLPFRSALVGAAQLAMAGEDGAEGAKAATVQPVAIAYTRMGGLPLGRQHRPHVAWYGGMDLGPHLARVLAEGGVDVEVVFCPPRRLGAGADRKRVTAEAGALVRRLVAGLNAGHAPEILLAEDATEFPTASGERASDRLRIPA
jgi:1-acyl-sn-glycerol-3-phosphate acyltransferase